MIRKAELADAPALLVYFRQLITETDFLLLTPEEGAELTVEKEQAFITSFANNMQHLLLLAVIDGQIAGSVSVRQHERKKQAHVGDLGIAILHQYWNMGIGRRLMTATMRWAEQHAVLEIIHLGVLVSNERAIQLYRNFGFQEYGRLPGGLKQADGTFGDLINMFKRVKS